MRSIMTSEHGKSLRKHAKQELALISTPKKMNKEILELIDVLEEQQYDPYMLQIFCMLAQYEPISPLTGADEEWEHADIDTLQNKRCAHVFKDKHSNQAFDIRGRVFRAKDGTCSVDRRSHINIEFPYTPKTKYIDV